MKPFAKTMLIVGCINAVSLVAFAFNFSLIYLLGVLYLTEFTAGIIVMMKAEWRPIGEGIMLTSIISFLVGFSICTIGFLGSFN